ncbi:MAG: hypothetical protein ACE5OY_03790 [Candidatus Bathyarchaeia archaeon]
MSEKFPVHETLSVLSGKTLYRTEKWWKAAVLTEAFGRRRISIYLWQKRNGEWRRRQKYTINSKDDWEKDKVAIEELINQL